MGRIDRSIPLKLCLSIFAIELVFLGLMGGLYSNRFQHEIDLRVAEKLRLPAALMVSGGFSYSSVRDFSVLSDITQEKINEAFIVKPDGRVFFSADPAKEGKAFVDLLGPTEKKLFSADFRTFSQVRQVEYLDREGQDYIAILAPLNRDGQTLGGLYMRIYGSEIKRQKRQVILIFVAGGLLTVVLSTAVIALIVYQLVLPRISHTSRILNLVEQGDLSARVGQYGPADQLGELISRVDTVLQTISAYTTRLQGLIAAGEAFADCRTPEEVVTKATVLIESQLPVVRQDAGAAQIMLEAKNSQGTKDAIVFTLPVQDTENDYTVLSFIGREDRPELDRVDREFITALSRMVTAAIQRTSAYQKIIAAEEKFRYLFTSAASGLYRSSPEGHLLEVNPAMVQMFGYASEEAMKRELKANLEKIYVDPLVHSQGVIRMAASGSVVEEDVHVRRKDGSTFHALMSCQPVRDEHGKMVAMDGRFIDISDRKLREQAQQDQLAAEAVSRIKSELVVELEERNRQLQDALLELKATQLQLGHSEKMAAIGMTAGGVAHDLNNILSGIISYPEYLLTTIAEESSLREPLAAILASGKRAAAVVADLLTLTMDTIRLDHRVPLNDLIRQHLASPEYVQIMSAHPDIVVVTVLDEGDALIHCSPIHIRKVLMNLIINAIEAAVGSGEVLIRTAMAGASGEESGGAKNSRQAVLLTVTTAGADREPASSRHIFEPLYTKRVLGQSGTGLGLTVVQNVIQAHGGAVGFVNTGGQTQFSVSLPVAEAQRSESTEESESLVTAGEGSVLVIDDEPLQREIAAKMLSRFGYTLEVCSSGEEAVAWLKEHQVDLIILDMLMPPGMNGLETYRRILELHPGQKAIVVSGFSENREAQLALQLGATAFVKKPYTMDQILRAISKALPAGQAEALV